jgi:hypothetical protein
MAKAKKKAAKKKTAAAKQKNAVKKSKKQRVIAKKKAPKKRGVVKRAKKSLSLDAFVFRLDAWQREIINMVRGLIRSVEQEARESVKWAQPVFELNGPFAFVRPAAKHVTLGFWRGAEMHDPYNKLEGTGSKMKHVKLRSSNDAALPSVVDYVRQAARLNREKGDPTKR